MPACDTNGISGVGEPPDVAADASPTQVVEFLNGGIYVFDKSGNVQTGFPQSLRAFWNSSSTKLSDTQIAYDRSINRWLATTFDFAANVLLFAVSNTSDASGSWTRLPATPISCPSNTQADQPILGFNQDWVAIDVLCANRTGPGFAPDELVLVPHTNLTQNPIVSSWNSGTLVQSALFFYVYQQGDSGLYTFIFNQNQTPLMEMAGFLVSYRGANTNSANFSAYGYGVYGSDTTKLSTASPLPVGNPEYALLNLFANACDQDDNIEPTQSSPFATPTGPSNPTVQTPLQLPAENGFLAADTATVAGGRYGPYSTTSCNGIGNVFQVLIPEGNGLPTSAGHPLFFAGEIPISGALFFLNFANTNFFGWYTYALPFIVHLDMGSEYFQSAVNDPTNGAYLYDSKLGTWLYTKFR